MSYYIDIIDTTSPLVQTVLKSASASGIVLEWNGGDAKDELSIVGSNLKFDMLTVDDSDAAFIDFFTGDEHRFKAQIKKSIDDTIIWQGYILPDLYEEPYKAVNFFVSFTASDGLGRLKGKFLPNDYYSREKSLIDIYIQILRLTGLELELYFAPAIENFIEKNWNKIFIDTETFIENNKRKDAYSIFETLLSDTLSVCYQCDNRWYIEGINMRHVRKVTYKKYDVGTNYLGSVVLDRLLKKITSLGTPSITIIPPYNEITINHKKEAPSLSKKVGSEVNDGWALVTGVSGIIDPSEWMANGNYYAKCPAPAYNTTIYNQFYYDSNSSTIWSQDDTKFISLRKKIYFQKSDKVKFTLEFSVVHPSTGTTGSVSDWNDVFKYEILYNSIVLFSNFGGVVEDREKVIFNAGGECKIEIEHVFIDEGLIDIRLYRPIGRVSSNGVLGIKLTNASIDIIGFNDEEIETDLINGDFTIDKTIDLTYAEDKSGFSNGFRLAKLKEETSTYNEIEINILYGFELDGKYFSVVQLEGANLIKENIYQVFYSGAPIRINDVVYNFNGGEQMVVETEVPYTSGSFYVKKYAVADVISSRSHWAQWADAFYKIENISYVKTVANIFRRMFNTAHEKLDVTAKNSVKFNDIIIFNYISEKDFVVLNCSWNLDNNTSELTLGRSNYKELSTSNPTDSNIPPIVIAGNDIYIGASQTAASLQATAYDPDGFITSQLWTNLEGAGAVIVSPTSLATNLTNLTEDLYSFQIEVTDNSGATALDSITIYRSKDYVVTLDLVEEVTNHTRPHLLRRKYKLNVTPGLLPGYVLTFTGLFWLYAKASSIAVRTAVVPVTSWYNLEKNGILLEGNSVTCTKQFTADIKDEKYPIVLNYIATDEIYITLCSSPYLYNPRQNDALISIANFKLQTVVMASGIGNITGVPAEIETYLN